VRIQYGSRLHVEKRGLKRAIRVQMRWVKFLKNGGYDAAWTVLMRVQQDLVVAVFGMVQIEVDLHFLGHWIASFRLLLVNDTNVILHAFESFFIFIHFMGLWVMVYGL